MSGPRLLEELIAEAAIFEGLSPGDLEFIAGCARNHVFEAGEQVFREGEAADTFYLIRRGQISLGVYVPGRGEVAVGSGGPGDVIGWSWLFPPYRWHLDARAVERTHVVAFDGACLRGKCDQDPRLGYELMKRFASVMIRRLQGTRLQLLDLYGRDG